MQHHITRRILGSTGLTVALVALLGVTPGAATGPTVHIEPADRLPTGSTTITVTGSGFDPAAANGNGIYLVFGPVTPPPAYYLDPSLYGAFKWLSPDGVDTAATGPLGADGTFSTTLDITSVMTTSAGEVDCAISPCAVITFAAHGSPDRSQDTCTAIGFLGGDLAEGSPAPSSAKAPPMSAAPALVSAPPASSADPSASLAPAADDVCAILVAPAS